MDEPLHARERWWPVGFEIKVNSRRPVMRVVLSCGKLMDDPIDNPYESPLLRGITGQQDNSRPSSKQARHLTALLLAVIGAPFGAMLCSAGYLGIIFILESAFVPPLHSPSTYGQFGFLLIVFGFFGLFYGASFGLLPYTRFGLWVPAFLLISFFAISGDIATHFDASEVTCTAMIVIGIIIVALAATTSYVLRWLDARGNSSYNHWKWQPKRRPARQPKSLILAVEKKATWRGES